MLANTDPEVKHADALLAWYDRHRRRLPWRALPGEAADPYRIWLSEIMLQQTTVKTVGPYFEAFVARWPDVGAMAASDVEDILKAWAGLGYYSRARNLHACARVVSGTLGGRFPDDVESLRKLPGVGAYTAAAVAAIAFGRRAAVVDGNVERVVTRLEAIETPLPQAKPLIAARVEAITPASRPGDFAQAYVIAHEVGHHVQKQLGILDKVQELKQRADDEATANQIQVRTELQADCLAGVWANLNDQMKKRLQPGDIEEALNAASQIGDDMIQKRMTGRVVPDAFTHGTAAQRVHWFKAGFESGRMDACDTFNTSNF